MKIRTISAVVIEMRQNNKNTSLYSARLAQSRKLLLLRASGDVVTAMGCRLCGFQRATWWCLVKSGKYSLSPHPAVPLQKSSSHTGPQGTCMRMFTEVLVSIVGMWR